MILDIILTVFFTFWAVMILLAAFQKPADMPKDFEHSDFPEKKIFDEDGKDINK